MQKYKHFYALSEEPSYDRYIVIDDCENGEVMDVWFQPSYWSRQLVATYDAVNKFKGKYGLRLHKEGYWLKTGLGLIPKKAFGFYGMNALRMWVKPDGSNETVSFGIMDGSGELYWTAVPDMLAGKEPYILQIPLMDLINISRRNNGIMDMFNFAEFYFWLNGSYDFYVDEIMFVHDPAIPEFIPTRANPAELKGDIYQINCGSIEIDLYQWDCFYDAESTITCFRYPGEIDIEGVEKPAPLLAYQMERYSEDKITYILPNLLPGDTYQVRLHFCENYELSTGERVMKITVNSKTAFAKFDIISETKIPHKAIVKECTAQADAEGRIIIVIAKVTGVAIINAIEIVK